jgi:antitoxin component YwqK of YwqJK toxin-antitoxin module
MDFIDIIILIIGIVSTFILPGIFILWIISKFINKPQKREEYYDTGELKRVFYEKKWKKKEEFKKEGKEITYYRSGEINKIKILKRGKQEGETIVYYKTGEKYILSYYTQDALDGEYTIYEKNGTIIESHTYNKGVKVS